MVQSAILGTVIGTVLGLSGQGAARAVLWGALSFVLGLPTLSLAFAAIVGHSDALERQQGGAE